MKSPELALLHYEGMAFEDWKQRALSRVNGKVVATRMSDERKAQMELIASTFDARGDAGLAALYEEMYVFDPERLRKAVLSGYVVDIRSMSSTTGVMRRFAQWFLKCTGR